MRPPRRPAGPPPARPGERGASLRDWDVSAPIEQLAGEYDPARLTAVWEADRAAPEWAGPPVWIHGDLHAGNLLVRGGTLAVVLDWSCLAVGDPAADLLPAWLLLDGPGRAEFRAALAPDEDTWRRGRAKAFGMALAALPYYRDTNPFLAALGRRGIAAVLSEVDG
ncbi:phosphotransferase [Dactylosporangium salmoneum]|uniref:Aminoglycoside phosphotransferase domain-containing protein n=1 Tax=Dactylosporangium salmoneum TaxID=53361 RepID=A0ABP5ULF5_9ACTN